MAGPRLQQTGAAAQEMPCIVIGVKAYEITMQDTKK